MTVTDFNTTALAFLGDAVYEVFIRKMILESGQVHGDMLHKQAVPYVRAEGQAKALRAMMADEGFLSEEEMNLVRRARNRKITSKPQHADPMDYKLATAFEALVGWLYESGQRERADEIMQTAVMKIKG